jgi:ATP-dependent Clp protease adaptor protein ClpS
VNRDVGRAGAVDHPVGATGLGVVVTPRKPSPKGHNYSGRVAVTGVQLSVAPVEVEQPDVDDKLEFDTPWVTIVWNDPVNLMSYVTYVFQTYFGYPQERAERLMLDVHRKGRAVVATGSREEMERDTEAMHEYGLWATFQKQ